MPVSNQDYLEALAEIRQKMLEGGNLASQQKQRQRAESKQRAEAENDTDKRPSILLRPNDLSGDYDTNRALMTTLGGKVRLITDDGIAAFKKNIAIIGKRFKGGITPNQVIKLSLLADRTRANQEILFCSPFSRKKGVQRFMTNASKESKHKRHYVDVEFLGFDLLVAADTKSNAGLVRKQIADGPIKFDCTCEHHTFRRRYIATIGGYAYGRQETAFPKLTNPGLSGVACKHVLRVMQFIISPLGVRYLQSQVERDRQKFTGKADQQTEAQIKKRLEQQQQDEANDKQKVRSQETREKAIKARKAFKERQKREDARRANALAKQHEQERARLQEQEQLALTRLQARQAALKEAESLKTVLSPAQYAIYLKGVEAEYPL